MKQIERRTWLLLAGILVNTAIAIVFFVKGNASVVVACIGFALLGCVHLRQSLVAAKTIRKTLIE